MSLDKKQVKEIAYLARLSIEDAELEQSTSELNNILSLMDDLNAVSYTHLTLPTIYSV